MRCYSLYVILFFSENKILFSKILYIGLKPLIILLSNFHTKKNDDKGCSCFINLSDSICVHSWEVWRRDWKTWTRCYFKFLCGENRVKYVAPNIYFLPWHFHLMFPLTSVSVWRTNRQVPGSGPGFGRWCGLACFFLPRLWQGQDKKVSSQSWCLRSNGSSAGLL